jgi:hypothetical protein
MYAKHNSGFSVTEVAQTTHKAAQFEPVMLFSYLLICIFNQDTSIYKSYDTKARAYYNQQAILKLLTAYW